MARILCPATSPSAITVNANATAFFAGGTNTLVAQTTEANSQLTWRSPGTFSFLYARVTANTVTATSTIRFRKNTANGNQTVSIPASTTGEFQDSSNTDTVVSGDIIDYTCVAGATGTSITFVSMATNFAATTGTVNRLAATAGSAIADSTASSTLYQCLCGLLAAFTATEANTQFKSKSSFTLQNFYINVTANTKATSSSSGSRKNGTTGNLVVSIPALTTGIFEDTTHSDTLASGDLFNYYLTQGAGATSISILMMAVDLISATNQTHILGMAQSLDSQPSSTRYTAPGGSTLHATTQSVAQMKANCIYVASNMECYLSSNGSTNPQTFTFQKNGSNANQTVSIPASTSGYFEDTVNTDIIAAPNEINYQVTNNSGNIVFTQKGHLATVVSTNVKWQQCAWSYPI